MNNTIAERIKLKRIELSLSQSELGKLASIAPSQLSRYESGVNKPSNLVASRLAKALNTDLEWLLTGNDDKDIKGVVSPSNQITIRSHAQDDPHQMTLTFSPDATHKLKEIAMRKGIDEYLLSMNLIYDAIDKKYDEVINGRAKPTQDKIFKQLKDIAQLKIDRAKAFMKAVISPKSRELIYGSMNDIESLPGRVYFIENDFENADKLLSEIEQEISNFEPEYIQLKKSGMLQQQYEKIRKGAIEKASSILPHELCCRIMNLKPETQAILKEEFNNWLNTQEIPVNYSSFFQEIRTALYYLRVAEITTFNEKNTIELIHDLEMRSIFKEAPLFQKDHPHSPIED